MRRNFLLLIGLVAGLSGCGSTRSDDPPVTEPPPDTPPDDGGALQCRQLTPPESPMALLTRREYDNTVADLLGDTTRPSSAFPPENEVQGFKNFTAAHQASPLLVERYLEAAEALAANAVTTGLDRIAPCAQGSDAIACGRAFVRSFGQRAFRRPLSSAEALVFDDLFGRMYVRSGYPTAVELVLQAMLQSPQFLYRVDTLSVPSPESGAVALGAFELASRLSYFLTGSMPDAELFQAAEQNRLSADADVESQARRLLATPRAREVVREFHRQWLSLDALSIVAREAPELGAEAELLGGDWLGSFDRFIDHVYWETGTLSELFSSKQVYVTPRLASLYGVTPPASDFAAVELPDRSGLLTQPGIVALLAHGDQSAPVLRGVFVRERLLCLAVPPPPPTVNAVPPDPDPNATTRERFRVHTEKVECSSCHKLIDGIGFGFEAYDQLGRYRTVENGFPVDVSGEVWGTNDVELDGTFQGVGELSARLGASQRVEDCVATSWFRYAFGRMETEADACSLEQVRERFSKSGGRFDELLVAITQSVAFRFRPPVSEDSP